MKPIPKISICIPFHWMDNWQFFLNRCLESIRSQSFKDYEIVLMNVGSMPVTSNRVMDSAKGELVKVLYMDDYLAHPDALKNIVENFTEGTAWLVTGCLHQSDKREFSVIEDMPEYAQEKPHSPHLPRYTKEIRNGVNTIGSPSVLTVRNSLHLLFDENMSWLLDCELYERYYHTYGAPKILDDLNVVIGVGSHQMTHILTDSQKQAESIYLQNKLQEPA